MITEEDELNWIRQVLSSDFHSDSKLTEYKLGWLKLVLGEDYEYDSTTLSAPYVRLKKTSLNAIQIKKL